MLQHLSYRDTTTLFLSKHILGGPRCNYPRPESCSIPAYPSASSDRSVGTPVPSRRSVTCTKCLTMAKLSGVLVDAVCRFRLWGLLSRRLVVLLSYVWSDHPALDSSS